MTIKAENSTDTAHKLLMYVDVVKETDTQIPKQLLWTTASFPASINGEPGKTRIHWEENFGFSVLQFGEDAGIKWSSSTSLITYAIIILL